MRKIIYPDNPVVRRLVLDEGSYSKEQRECLIKFYKNNFGISCFLVNCPYLFLEFIGVTKKHLDLCSFSKFEIDPKVSLNSINNHQMIKIDKNIRALRKKIEKEIRHKLSKNVSFIKERVSGTIQIAYKDEFSKKIIDRLFSCYIDDLMRNFDRFLIKFTGALYWDIFAAMDSNNLIVLRERQLGFWLEQRKFNYPFGKIIDDQSHYYNHSFPEKNFFFQSKKDMVDSKMATLSVTGYSQNGEIRSVDSVQFFPDVNTIKERAILALRRRLII